MTEPNAVAIKLVKAMEHHGLAGISDKRWIKGPTTVMPRAIARMKWANMYIQVHSINSQTTSFVVSLMKSAFNGGETLFRLTVSQEANTTNVATCLVEDIRDMPSSALLHILSMVDRMQQLANIDLNSFQAANNRNLARQLLESQADIAEFRQEQAAAVEMYQQAVGQSRWMIYKGMAHEGQETELSLAWRNHPKRSFSLDPKFKNAQFADMLGRLGFDEDKFELSPDI